MLNFIVVKFTEHAIDHFHRGKCTVQWHYEHPHCGATITPASQDSPSCTAKTLFPLNSSPCFLPPAPRFSHSPRPPVPAFLHWVSRLQVHLCCDVAELASFLWLKNIPLRP